MLITNNTNVTYWFGPHTLPGNGTLTLDDTSDTSLYLTDDTVADAVNTLWQSNDISVSSAASPFPRPTGTPAVLHGDGSPQGKIYAGQGSLYLRRDNTGGATALFSKTSGVTYNTGWASITDPWSGFNQSLGLQIFDLSRPHGDRLGGAQHRDDDRRRHLAQRRQRPQRPRRQLRHQRHADLRLLRPLLLQPEPEHHHPGRVDKQHRLFVRNGGMGGGAIPGLKRQHPLHGPPVGALLPRCALRHRNDAADHLHHRRRLAGVTAVLVDLPLLHRRKPELAPVNRDNPVTKHRHALDRRVLVHRF